MKRFLSAIDTLNHWVGVSVSYMMLLVLGVTLFEVISRFVFNYPTVWAYEVTGNLFGFYMIIGGGYVLLHKAHIRVDVFWSKFSLRNQAIIDLATCVFVFLFLGLLLWTSSDNAWRSIQILEHGITPFAPPIYPLKVCLVIGVLLILLQLIVKTIRDLYLAITGVESD